MGPVLRVGADPLLQSPPGMAKGRADALPLSALERSWRYTAAGPSGADIA